jgi:hypothetical protein
MGLLGNTAKGEGVIMTIFHIALAVFIFAIFFRQCRRQIKRAQLNKLYVSAAWRKYQLEKPDECELDKP